MCGIAGLIDKNNLLLDNEKKSIASSFVHILEHRGGDGSGTFFEDNLLITHNRLAITDLSEKSKQPIYSERSVLSYNGEIYNYEYIGSKQYNSDTLALFNFLEQSGDVQKLDGMFAYSFFDRINKKLTLQVDRFGIKPLYYYHDKNYFVWASEIKVFKEIPGVRFDFNDSRLEEFLSFRYILGSETLIKNVFRVLPGEEVIFDLNNNQIITNNLINNCVFESKPFSSDFPALIEKTIKSQMVSAVPIGVQLSGGIDSTLVASILAKYSDHVYTYSIGMEDDSWNEFIYSDMVAKNISSIHTKITFSKEEFKKLFRDVTYYLDEPIVHPNTVPLFLLAKEARKKVKVFLTGEGADELLGGYKRYNLLVGGIYFNSFTESNIVKRILLNHCKISRRSQLFRGLKGKYIEKYFAYDIATYLPHVLLRQDKVNMAVALEARVPFLSNEISRYLYHLELSEKNGEYGQKNILKHFLKDYFKYDDQFLEREKCGFGLPIKDWLIDPEVFLEDIKNLPKQLVICTHFNVKEVENLINNHLSKKEDNSAILFTLLGLSVWYDLFIG